LVKGDLTGIVRARRLSRATLANIRQNLIFAFGYNSVGVPIAAGVLYPAFGLLLSPMIAAAAMSFSSVSVIGNALRLDPGSICAWLRSRVRCHRAGILVRPRWQERQDVDHDRDAAADHRGADRAATAGLAADPAGRT